VKQDDVKPRVKGILSVQVNEDGKKYRREEPTREGNW